MSLSFEDTAIIILAAGKGTRMKSDKAKVLHEINGVPMVNYVVQTAVQIVGDRIILVIGHQAEQVRKIVSEHCDGLTFAIQEEQLGTGHAVQCAIPYLSENIHHVVILCGDVPLITPATIQSLLKAHKTEKRDLTVLGVEMENPEGYGRMVVDAQNRVTAIVEDADATAEQKKIRIVNSGIYCSDRNFLNQSVNQIQANNAQEEYYLTDILEIGRKAKKNVGVEIFRNCEEVMGVNTLEDLELSENIAKNMNIERS